MFGSLKKSFTGGKHKPPRNPHQDIAVASKPKKIIPHTMFLLSTGETITHPTLIFQKKRNLQPAYTILQDIIQSQHHSNLWELVISPQMPANGPRSSLLVALAIECADVVNFATKQPGQNGFFIENSRLKNLIQTVLANKESPIFTLIQQLDQYGIKQITCLYAALYYLLAAFTRHINSPKPEHDNNMSWQNFMAPYIDVNNHLFCVGINNIIKFLDIANQSILSAKNQIELCTECLGQYIRNKNITIENLQAVIYSDADLYENHPTNKPQIIESGVQLGI